MRERVLITGGAGFIGSHLADELLHHGAAVRVLDILAPQVHGPAGEVPDYLDREVEFIRGDVRDPQTVRKCLENVDAVVHLAAAVGVGQSMYSVAHYADHNVVGTGVLLETLVQRPVRKLVVASSMSVYGEGLYRSRSGAPRPGSRRSRTQLERGQWELMDEDGGALVPIATPESKPIDLASVYALTKLDQERLCTMLGAVYGIDTVALRFFNVYGPRQALSNPYTGVLAIFSARLLNDRSPVIFEDGGQQRDFVSVHDVARACRLALERDEAAGEVLNIGSGEPRTISFVAQALASILGKDTITAEMPGRYRAGDIRHCFADIGRARRVLGFAPQVPFDAGLLELASWLDGRTAVDRVADAQRELSTRGLTLETTPSLARTRAPEGTTP